MAGDVQYTQRIACTLHSIRKDEMEKNVSVVMTEKLQAIKLYQDPIF